MRRRCCGEKGGNIRGETPGRSGSFFNMTQTHTHTLRSLTPLTYAPPTSRATSRPGPADEDENQSEVLQTRLRYARCCSAASQSLSGFTSRSYSSTSFEDAVKKAEEPPTPPPRPQKSHSRASSLDLNKLFQQGAPGRIHSSLFFLLGCAWWWIKVVQKHKQSKVTFKKIKDGANLLILIRDWNTRCFTAACGRRRVFNRSLVGVFLYFKERNVAPERTET